MTGAMHDVDINSWGSGMILSASLAEKTRYLSRSSHHTGIIAALIPLVLPLLLCADVVLAQEGGRRNEMVITGRVQGPPLWQVRRGEHRLWIFGLLNPLPEKLEWDDSRVRRIIAAADVFLEAPGYSSEEKLGVFKGIGLYRDYRQMRSNMPGDHLQQVLNAEDYAALLSVKERFGPRSNRLFRMRPLFAAREVWEAGLDHAGLEYPRKIARHIERLVKRADLPIIAAEYTFDVSYRSLMEEVNSMPLDQEIQCLNSLVSSIATDMDDMQARARSWAYGYMGEIYAQQYPNPRADCLSALTYGEQVAAIQVGANALWLSQAEAALAEYEVSFAVLPMYQILERGGLIDQLQQRGYTLIEP